MCNSKYNLKLCTCSDVGKTDSHWSLKRFIGCDWLNIETGRCFLPEYTKEDISLGRQILGDLNNTICFDFDFHPEEGDTLNIMFNLPDSKTSYEFIYQNNIWRMENSISAHLNEENIIQKGNIEFQNT